MSVEIVRGGIRLPCSATTRADRYRSFAKLLSHVDDDAMTGFGFQGRMLRPGALVTPAELHPGSEYPATPVLLEYAAAGIPGTNVGTGTGHNRRASVYVLWRYHSSEWVEIGRAVSESWTWALDLGPIARRALAESRSVSVVVVVDVRQIAVRIANLLDAELRALNAGDRQRIIAILHDQFACRFL
jgi:hypothetical protein